MTETISITALKPLPYHRIRLPGETFAATAGYAAFFKSRGLARDATPAEAGATAPELPAAPEQAAAGKPKRAARKKLAGRYSRRDMRAGE